MANELINGAIMAQALCMELANAFRARDIKTIPHDRWNVELRGDEKDLVLVWYDLPPMCDHDRCLSIGRFCEWFFRESCQAIAEMITERTLAPIEMLTLGMAGCAHFEMANRCFSPETGVQVHLYQAYNAVTNTMPWWTRLVYRIHPIQQASIEEIQDAMRMAGLLDYGESPSAQDIAIARLQWRQGMGRFAFAAQLGRCYNIPPKAIYELDRQAAERKLRETLRQQYVKGPMGHPTGFEWYMDQNLKPNAP